MKVYSDYGGVLIVLAHFTWGSGSWNKLGIGKWVNVVLGHFAVLNQEGSPYDFSWVKHREYCIGKTHKEEQREIWERETDWNSGKTTKLRQREIWLSTVKRKDMKIDKVDQGDMQSTGRGKVDDGKGWQIKLRMTWRSIVRRRRSTIRRKVDPWSLMLWTIDRDE